MKQLERTQMNAVKAGAAKKEAQKEAQKVEKKAEKKVGK